MPAREAPAMTTEPITKGSVLGDGDGLLGAALHALLDLGPILFARGLVQDVEEVVVAHLEDLGRDPHADRVALTQVVVDHYSHLGPLGSVNCSSGEGSSCLTRSTAAPRRRHGAQNTV